ncbi:nucleotidyltransferase family protein [Nocardioides zeae]|uniref:NTP transferase domain-containing protein n=1 Tax=Nocardioides zeae TaxID=1457234 RepID=A0A6P0HLD7_9ACTN|nr:NTP transferase domain-containing protein [Nocardioides zeae]NEN79519.1 NTP transferase domain-containing protein [Nocardioides zeae]
MSDVDGLLLAAGAGRRMGRPKALVDDWLPRSLRALRDGGCRRLTVVIGAAADEVRPLVPVDVAVVVADDWADGMGASLRAGLGALSDDSPGVLVHLVDLPDVGAAVVRRVLGAWSGPTTLARASYGPPGSAEPGHPVLLGAAHVAGVRASAAGDRGARRYLADRDVRLVDCADLASGRDVDRR